MLLFQIAYPDGEWCTLDRDTCENMSNFLYAGGDIAGFVVECGERGSGTYWVDGQLTPLRRYVLDFVQMAQRNIDSGSKRTMRILITPNPILEWPTRVHDDDKRWTGQKREVELEYMYEVREDTDWIQITIDSNGQAMNAEAGSAEQLARGLAIELAFKDGWWWRLPQNVSQRFITKYQRGENAHYVWYDRAEKKSRYYIIDFVKMVQQNLRSGSYRSIRIRPRDPNWDQRASGAHSAHIGCPHWVWDDGQTWTGQISKQVDYTALLCDTALL